MTAERPNADAVVTHSLTKRFGPLVAVEGLDLSIRRGEVFGLLGPTARARPRQFECSAV